MRKLKLLILDKDRGEGQRSVGRKEEKQTAKHRLKVERKYIYVFL